MLYPILTKVLYYIESSSFNANGLISLAPDFSQFSYSWVCVIYFVIIVPIIFKKDLGFFIRMSTYGVFCIFVQIFFVLGIAIYSFTNTTYEVTVTARPPTEENDMAISLFRENFYPLMGVMSAGFYLHGLGLPILSENKNKKKNERDVFLGFSVVSLNYIFIGVLGTFGFSGTYFIALGHTTLT